eukprot:6144159-Pleurochrysis_carterae.AAC.2
MTPPALLAYCFGPLDPITLAVRPACAAESPLKRSDPALSTPRAVLSRAAPCRNPLLLCTRTRVKPSHKSNHTKPVGCTRERSPPASDPTPCQVRSIQGMRPLDAAVRATLRACVPETNCGACDVAWVRARDQLCCRIARVETPLDGLAACVWSSGCER